MMRRLTNLIFLSFFASCAANTRQANRSERAPASAPKATKTPVVDAGQNVMHTQFKHLRSGIFEVVYNWKEGLTEGLELSEPYPYHRLPVALRKDDYTSIGTAFAVSPTVILSAAHVFTPDQRSYRNKSIALRDAEGNIHELNKVVRYSDHKDLIAFTLKSYPKNMRPLQMVKSDRPGRKVFTVGNALGQGVVVRSGHITSFTLEEVKGNWNFIRFTAPASPGNSGGPLLDSKGRVHGVVVRKSQNENLNYAVPTSVVAGLSKSSAEYYVPESDYNKEATYNVPIPMNYRKFEEKLMAMTEQLTMKVMERAIVKSTGGDLSKMEGIEEYLHNQRLNTFMFTLGSKKGRMVYYSPEKYQSVKIGRDRYIKYSSADAKKFSFYLPTPEGTSLLELTESPRVKMDMIIQNVFNELPIMGEKVSLTSLGEAKQSEWFEDNFGRKWQSALWDFGRTDISFALYCLPQPKGSYCNLHFTNLSLEKGLDHIVKKFVVNNMVGGLSGRFDEWASYFKLPANYLPRSVQNYKIKKSNKKIVFNFDGISGEVPLFDTRKGSLSIRNHLVSKNGNEIRPGQVLFFKGLNVDAYIFTRVYSPHKNSDRSILDDWNNILKRQAPYHGKEYRNKDNHVSIVSVSEQPSRSLASVDFAENAKLILNCSMDSKTYGKNRAQECKNFIKLNKGILQ